MHNATGMLFVPLRLVSIDFFGEKKELIECALVNMNADGTPPHRIGTRPEQLKLFFYSQLAVYYRPLCGCEIDGFHIQLPEKLALDEKRFAGLV